MKTPIFIAIAALTLIAGTDKPKSPPAIKAHRTYEDSVRAADGQQRQALKAAQDEYLTKLKEAKDSALEVNDLKAANEIEAALKAIAMKRPVLAPTFQLAIEAQRSHEDSVQAANEQQLVALKRAEEVYQTELQAALDSAIASKDLTEANRIDAAMKEMQQKIDARDAASTPALSITNSIGMTFVEIPAGEFTMGSPRFEAGREQDETERRIKLTESFGMGIHEVTQAQYEQVVGRNPSQFKGVNNPVEVVSWDDAAEFCRLLTALPAERAAGRNYRLPTETEWEYACRAGTTTAYSFGNDDSPLGQYAWYDKTSGKRSHPVGHRQGNAWGLYDMHGNVWEWCEDKEGSFRVIRGGGWNNDAAGCRTANRLSSGPPHPRADRGFRLVLSPSGQ